MKLLLCFLEICLHLSLYKTIPTYSSSKCSHQASIPVTHHNPATSPAMSSVPPGGLILITGANGYIASVAVHVFLQRGYRVRGTVRSITANTWMKTFFGSNFELVQVPDISTPGAFDEALKDVNGVVHTAMNMDMNPQNQGVIDDTINSNLY